MNSQDIRLSEDGNRTRSRGNALLNQLYTEDTYIIYRAELGANSLNEGLLEPLPNRVLFQKDGLVDADGACFPIKSFYIFFDARVILFFCLRIVCYYYGRLHAIFDLLPTHTTQDNVKYSANLLNLLKLRTENNTALPYFIMS
ncbi:hypothetical protein Zmor_020738 [Zophobas morio]|uniref:Uncharacterized protein n=1 Tax=Zophobas morio TaxID=2755281 RepID=A0AA38I1R1_9CUCU|nr:hypothetical protein Zmor_020738 [Zophobas morio]